MIDRKKSLIKHNKAITLNTMKSEDIQAEFEALRKEIKQLQDQIDSLKIELQSVHSNSYLMGQDLARVKKTAGTFLQHAL